MKKSMRGFSLVELLVVISIIAILASLLLPALSRAKEAGRLARCKSNEHQLGLALNVYAGDLGVFPLRAQRRADGKPVEWFDQLSLYLANAKWGQGVYKCPAYKWDVSVPLNDPGEDVVGSYAYNCFGYTPNSTFYAYAPDRSGGLGGDADNTPVPESRVKVPSDMYAFGDSSVLWEVNQNSHTSGGLDFYPVSSFMLTNNVIGERKKTIIQHRRGYNMVFVDAHVEFVAEDKLFSAEPMYWRRWNRAHWAQGDP
jgi:prepilin-type N-terminal cleavage/methylation domain-containing protein/prepilin-type processing-associated H-X9-DG protein